jgi:C1A family cysteine protease
MTINPDRRYGWRPSPAYRRTRLYTAASLDGVFDYDLRALMPPVYNQGNTGSCVWQATSAAMEYLRQRETLTVFTPSRLWGYYQTRVVENCVAADAGCTVADAMVVANKLGVPPESLWPFDPANVLVKPPSDLMLAAETDMALGYQVVANRITAILSCFKDGSPVIIGCTVFAGIQSEGAATTGYIPMPAPDEAPDGGHAMLLVGYQSGPRRFIVRNSWSSAWGDKGYGYLDAEYVTNASITDELWCISKV